MAFTNGIACSGTVSPLPEVTAGVATTKWAVGRVSPIIVDDIAAHGETPVVSWGRVKPKTTRFFATGASGFPISAGQVFHPREAIVATGGTAIVGFGRVFSLREAISAAGVSTVAGRGRVSEKTPVVGAYGWGTIYGHGQISDMPPVVASNGSVPVLIVGTGRINDYTPIVFSSGSPAILGWGNAGDHLTNISAAGFIGIIGTGRIASQPHVVSIRGSSGAWSGILQFERSQAIKATSPATATSPLSFSR